MRRMLVSACLLLVTLLACEREPQAGEPPAAQKSPPATASTGAPGSGPDSAAAPDAPAPAPNNYTVRIVPGDAAAGKAATSVVEISPGPGFKMNLEFPTRLRVSPLAGVALAKADFSKDDAELTEALLRFRVPFTAAKAGKITLSGTGDFSVCNEASCKLIRDEKLAWDIVVKP